MEDAPRRTIHHSELGPAQASVLIKGEQIVGLFASLVVRVELALR